MNHQHSRADTISISFSTEPVTVRWGDTVVAESHSAVVLHETGYADRYYFPRLDVKMDFLKASDKTTHCPHKGNAEYFSIETRNGRRDDLAWSYPAAKLGVAEISGYIAFHDDDPELSIA
ncbi:MAG: DUF427 domain-containing protein [Rhodospirillales bacterium]